MISCCCRWSKIAKHLPGRTDNEIKNFWRTRIQKHIKQAENCAAQTCNSTSENHLINYNDQASTSHMSPSPPDHHQAFDQMTYSPPAYPGNLENLQALSFPTEPPNENMWSMEDYWSLQMLNAE